MKKTGSLIKYFDKALLVLALVVAAGWIYFSIQIPFGLMDQSDISTKLERIKNWKEKGGGEVTFENEYDENSKKFDKALKEDATHFQGGNWLNYLSPTPRPFKKIIVTPPPKRDVKLSSVASASAVSVPGKVTLTWKTPPISTGVKLEGYYVFRNPADTPFGSFSIDSKLKVVLGSGNSINVPIAGPSNELSFTDTTVAPDTAYHYVVVAFGFPGREIMKDGKVVVGESGKPLMERISEQPIAAVSKLLSGKTVEENQIFLKGSVNNIAGNFVVFKWDRKKETWLEASFLNVPIGKKIGDSKKVNKVPVDFSTGWFLSSIGKELVEKNGRRRNLEFAVLVNSRNRKLVRKIYFERNRTPVSVSSKFNLSSISVGEKKN